MDARWANGCRGAGARGGGGVSREGARSGRAMGLGCPSCLDPATPVGHRSRLEESPPEPDPAIQPRPLSSPPTPFEPGVGPAYRQIVDLGSLQQSLWVIPGGSSGDPLSRHYADQLPDWRHGRYHPMMPEAASVFEVLELTPSSRERL